VSLTVGRPRLLTAIGSLALVALAPATPRAIDDERLLVTGSHLSRRTVARHARRPMTKTRLLRVGDGSWTAFLNQTRHDFYHLPGYVALEAHREGGEPMALVVERDGARMLLPLVIRPIPGGGHDATSPYGYGGPLLSGTGSTAFQSEALLEGSRFLAAEGIVSVFVRLHPLLNRDPPDGVGSLVRHGETVSIDLTLPTDVAWRQMRENHRRDITRAIATGHRVSIGRWDSHFETFIHQYRATMGRLAAHPRYLLGDAYLEQLREALGDRLHVATVEVDGATAGAGLYVETCGIVQSHLVARDERFVRPSPTKLMHHVVGDWARQRGNQWLHLGGGLGAADDSLFAFKAGFSPIRHPFHTMRIVTQDEAYRRLVADRHGRPDPRERDGFFPLYRQG
jgi:hypothetical protein